MGENFVIRPLMMKWMRTILLVVMSWFFVSCAEKEVVTKAHQATYINDVFGIDNGMPIREIQKHEFYFKKCELESRRPFPTRVEYSCNEN